MRFTGLLTRLSLVALFVATVYVGVLVFRMNTGGLLSDDERTVINYLSTRLEAGDETVSLKSAIPTEWTKVCAFPPYLDKATVERAFGTPFPNYSDYHWFEHDGYKTLIFQTPNSPLLPVRVQRITIGEINIPARSDYVCAGSNGKLLVERNPRDTQPVIKLTLVNS